MDGNIKNEMNILSLSFIDKNLEHDFCIKNDYDHRIFNRVGLFLSLFGWTVALITTLLILNLPLTSLNLVFIIFIYLFILTNIVITFIPSLKHLYQILTAIANLIAGLLFIYFSYSINDEQSFLVSLINVTFYAHFILRIRFKLSVIITFMYNFAGAVTYGFMENNSVLVNEMQVSLLVSFISITVGGYILERTTRLSFLKDNLIKTQQELLNIEHEKSERLLLNILPSEIADRLKKKDEIIADHYDSVSVFFADIVDFTKLSGQMTAKGIVLLLNDLFFRFDNLVEKYGLEKIKTIGDAYMVVSGLPSPSEKHAETIIQFAKEIFRELDKYNNEKNTQIELRIGINSGPVVAGVIGKKKFLYDLWGDTVNTASRMESHGLKGHIHLTEATKGLLSKENNLRDRGLIQIKGKGEMHTYLLKP